MSAALEIYAPEEALITPARLPDAAEVYGRKYRSENYTPGQCRVLLALIDAADIRESAYTYGALVTATQADIAQAAGVSRTTVGRALTRMEEVGDVIVEHSARNASDASRIWVGVLPKRARYQWEARNLLAALLCNAKARKPRSDSARAKAALAAKKKTRKGK